MAIRIITDSTVDIADSYMSRFIVVPLTVSFGEDDYIDGVTINKQEFYQKLISSPELPKTSQATPEAFAKVFRQLRDQGDEGVVITVSSCLSGTWQSACLAAEDFENIRVVDSRNVSIASGVLALYALRCAEDGMTLDALARHLSKKRDEIGLVAMVDTLEYLKKGGRISAAAALAGGLLGIKPVVTCREGELAVLGKARGSKKANNLLVEQIRKDGIDFSMPLLLGYTGLSDDLLRRYIEDSRCLWEGRVTRLDCVHLSSVIGTHAGPGAVAVAYFKSNTVK
ncbi:MAG: DegV family protein [Lachnospiraceae bacterium]|nr:DegV family protein [Lachnospiraceae bacterium]